MPSDKIHCVELVALKALADLERIEVPWVELIAGDDPEGVAVILRLLLAHMASTSKRLLGAMVLDRLDVETDAVERPTASEAVGRSQIESGPAA